MNEWHSPKDKLPPQAKKVLCVNRGDFYVAQRFGEYFLPIPFCDSVHAKDNYEMPDRWQDIDFPFPFTGFMHFAVEDGELLTMDQLEEKYPENYKEIVLMYVSSVNKLKR